MGQTDRKFQVHPSDGGTLAGSATPDQPCLDIKGERGRDLRELRVSYHYSQKTTGALALLYNGSTCIKLREGSEDMGRLLDTLTSLSTFNFHWDQNTINDQEQK